MTRRSAASFARGAAKFKVQARVLVLCEDSKSSKTYLEDASKYFRATAQVQIAHPGRTDPLGVVQAGVKQQSAFDAVYCVVDRDSHANWEQAIDLGFIRKLNYILESPVMRRRRCRWPRRMPIRGK